MNEIEKELNDLNDRYLYLERKLDNYEQLMHREKCPCCNQEIDCSFYEKEIPRIKSKLLKIANQRDLLIPRVIEIEKEEARKYHEEQQEKKNRVNEYIQRNRNKLNKAIRDYNNGIDNYLPSIPDSEKETWNEAMEWHLDNRNMDDNDELCFEL